MKYGDNNVITGPAIIIWDGVTQPELKEAKGNQPAFTQYSLKVAAHPQSPEIAELQQIVQAALTADTTFRGQMPPGGNYPLVQNDPNKYEGKLAGYIEFNTKTRRVPQVYDANNQELPPHVYGPMLYPGAVVRLIVSAYTFNNVSKGVTFSLNGIQIIDASTPRLPVGGVDAAAGFASAGMPAHTPAMPQMPMGAPAPQMPAAPGLPSAPAFVAPAAPAYTAAPAPMQPAPMMPAAVPTAPAHDYLTPMQPGMAPPPAPPARVMTTAAQGIPYESYIAHGWTDAMLIQNGLMMP